MEGELQAPRQPAKKLPQGSWKLPLHNHFTKFLTLPPGAGSPRYMLFVSMVFMLLLTIFFWWCYANCITFATYIIFLRYEHGIFFT